MRFANLFTILVLLACAPLSSPAAGPAKRVRGITLFDNDWRFFKGDAPGAEKPDFSDAAWLTLNVPHDWSIDGPFDQKNPTGKGGGYLPSGVGWYRKSFTLPEGYAKRRIFIEFDGVMANSDVWINGHHLGNRPYGYVSFRYELTGRLNIGAGKANLLAVRADTSAQPASRWYSGAGIYRHVRLVATAPVHIEPWGTYVTTPKVSAENARVHVRTTVVNQSDAPQKIALQTTIVSPDGQPVGAGEATPLTIEAGKSVDFQRDMAIANPRLWDLEHPNLYRAETKLLSDGAALDDDAVTFGIREFKFEPATGFHLNGKNMKLKGVCLHQDAGALGVAVPLRAWERRFQILKQLGVNAIRTAHHPFDPGFLDLADRMGFVVMDEFFDCWRVGKPKYDYHLYFDQWSKTDVADTVRRDRNHPSIALYSIGNEIHDTPRAESAKQILAGLRDVCHEFDPSRPVTQALFRPNVSHDYDNGLADLLDVIGQNYRENEILAAHAAKPTRKIIGTENTHDRRGWLALRDNAPYAGQFLWTGIDYLGESTWPQISWNTSLVDRTGVIRPMGYERQSWWAEQPVVHIARRIAASARMATDPGYETGPARRTNIALVSDWTPAVLAPHEERVEVYSNCERVELFLNGKSLGSQPLPADASARIWKVPFEAGTIQAIGTNKGKSVATHELHTAGKPAKIILSPDRPALSANWEDVCTVTATVIDDQGIQCPGASDMISFKLAGPGKIAAVDNGDPESHEPFHASQRSAYLGQCIAILKASAPGGKLTLTASAPGLAEGMATIETTASMNEEK